MYTAGSPPFIYFLLMCVVVPSKPSGTNHPNSPTLIRAHGYPHSILPGGHRPIFILFCIHNVVLMLDRQYLFPVEPNLYERLISLGEPEPADLLVLSHEVGLLYPKRQFLCWMSFDPDDGVVVSINPQFAFEQILVFPLGDRLRDETVVRSNLLFTEQFQRIVRG